MTKPGIISIAENIHCSLTQVIITRSLKRPAMRIRMYSMHLRKKTGSGLIDVLENYRRSGQNMGTAISTLKKNMTAVLNSVEYDFSNGPVEGINRRIKSLKRSCFGFRNLDNFRKRIALIRS